MKYSKDSKEYRLQEVRAEENGETMVLEGYPVVFNQETLIGDEEWGFTEVIERGAFDECDTSDCCLKYNHGDTKCVLARTRNKSLELSVDEHGVKMKATLIDTSDCRDMYKCVKSGLLDKMSFAFTVAKDGEEVTRTKDGKYKRTIKKIAKLWDCAIVDVPAYDGTKIYARSKELVGEQILNIEKSLENDKRKVETLLELEILKANIKGGNF